MAVAAVATTPVAAAAAGSPGSGSALAPCGVPMETLRFSCRVKCTNGFAFSCVSLDTSAYTGNSPACDSVGALGECDPSDYTCTTLCFVKSTDQPRAYKFYIPFGAWQSDYEKEARSNWPAIWQRQVDSLPATSTGVPYLSNDYLTAIEPLQLNTNFESVDVAGGFSSDKCVKGKVANVALANDLLVNATSVTSLTLANLNLGTTTPSELTGLLLRAPMALTKITLFNCLLTEMPSNLSQLKALTSLNVSHNFLTTVGAADNSSVLPPSLASLDLSFNNLTSFFDTEEATPLFPKLEILDLSGNFLDAIPMAVFTLSSLTTLRISQNPLRLAALTPSQFEFLSKISTFQLDQFQSQVNCAKGQQKTLPTSSKTSSIIVCVTSDLEDLQPVANPSSASSSTGSVVAMIGGCVVAVVVLLVAGVFMWKKKKTESKTNQPPRGLLASHRQCESGDSDMSAGGDFVKHHDAADPAQGLLVAAGGGGSLSSLSSSTQSVVSPQQQLGGHDDDHSLLLPTGLPSSSLSSSAPLMLSGQSHSSGASNASSSQASSYSSSYPFPPSLLVSKRLRPTTTHPSSSSSTTTQLAAAGVVSIWDDDDLQARQLKYEDIDDVRLIGSGGHGVVWLVTYRQTRLFASKRLIQDQVNRSKIYNFVTEIKIVSRLNHPCIVVFVGVAWNNETDLQALFEYMENGDLKTLLDHSVPSEDPRQQQRKGSSPPPRGSSSSSSAISEEKHSHEEEEAPLALSWIRDKWQLALSIVQALVYIHSFHPPLIHRDIKARNVLLNHEYKAKLSDFGVARFGSENSDDDSSATSSSNSMTTSVGTGRWQAPEVISGSKDYDPACDMYAFGVLLSELDTHCIPYDEVRGPMGNKLPEIAIWQLVAENQLKPTFLDTTPREIVEIAMQCLSFEPSLRPTAYEIAFKLRTFGRQHGFYDELK